MSCFLEKLHRQLRNRRGFTLIEMVIVLFIIAILLLIIIPNATKTQEKAQSKADAAIVKTVETEQALYKMDHNGTEGSMEQLKGEGYLTAEQIEAYEKAKE
ncbi:MAG: competence type IV pilus major pilin ComGC [Aerococcus sp.]|nr:competence type IV pilus major pilin ComGC [Aerococcus sp.]